MAQHLSNVQLNMLRGRAAKPGSGNGARNLRSFCGDVRVRALLPDLTLQRFRTWPRAPAAVAGPGLSLPRHAASSADARVMSMHTHTHTLTAVQLNLQPINIPGKTWLLPGLHRNYVGLPEKSGCPGKFNSQINNK